MSSANIKKVRIWIDFENSPHVLFFKPIIKKLEEKGYEVVLSARDYAQVIQLCDLNKLTYKKIGKHFGKNKLMKYAGLLLRTLQLLPFAIRNKPALSLSHGSRAQLIVASALRIPAMLAMDYEFGQGVPLIKADLFMIPEVVKEESFLPFAKRVSKYPGIKEFVYASDFTPDNSIKKILDFNDEDLVVTIRPPATSAHYHTTKSDELFNKAMKHVLSQENSKIFILPRTKDQAAEIRNKWEAFFTNGKIMIPDKVVDGLNLIWHSDLVISGGGTMIREAAALDVPAYSTFGGEIGNVDKFLEQTGKLILIKNNDDIHSKIKLVKRNKISPASTGNSETMQAILNEIEFLANGKKV